MRAAQARVSTCVPAKTTTMRLCQLFSMAAKTHPSQRTADRRGALGEVGGPCMLQGRIVHGGCQAALPLC